MHFLEKKNANILVRFANQKHVTIACVYVPCAICVMTLAVNVIFNIAHKMCILAGILLQFGIYSFKSIILITALDQQIVFFLSVFIL